MRSSTPPTSQPSASVGIGQTTNTDGSTSTLYLYTFLVTLILLSSISVIIVARSYLLRRRFRRQVEDALRNGQVLTPDGLAPGLVGLSSSATSRLLGPPPKLWDVWVQPSSLTTRRPSTPDEEEVESTRTDKFPWTELRPLSAEIISQKSVKLNTRWIRPPPIEDQTESRLSVRRPWRRSYASSVPSRGKIAPTIPEVLPEKDPQIRVVTLISMPSPHRVRPAALTRASSDSSWYKGKGREDRLDLTPLAVAVTELKVIMEEEDGDGPSN